jgi:hypothetical protein
MGLGASSCAPAGAAIRVGLPTATELEEFYSFASGFHVEFRDDQEEIASRFALARRQYAAIARHRSVGRCWLGPESVPGDEVLVVAQRPVQARIGRGPA